MKLAKAVVGAWVAVCANAFGGISIDCKYPGGNVKVDGIDEEKGVVNIRPDLRDTKGNWFHWDFTVRRSRGDRPTERTLHFQFPKNKFDYLSSLGPAISKDGGKTWRWLNADGRRHEPNNAFDYTFGGGENETRFAVSIPYSQKDWDAASERDALRGVDSVFAEGLGCGERTLAREGRREVRRALLVAERPPRHGAAAHSVSEG